MAKQGQQLWKKFKVVLSLHNPRRSRQVSGQKYRRGKFESLPRWGAAAGVKAARPKTPRHLLAVTCSCPGEFVMDQSCLMCHFQIRQATRSQAESAGGVSSLYFAIIRPLPASTLRAQAEPLFRSKSRHKPGSWSNCEVSSRLPVKGAVCRGYLVF